MTANRMKIIHISDLSINLDYTLLSDSPERIVGLIKEKYLKTDIFLININYKADTINRAENAGILFLKYLRLNHFNQQCILYSFLSREQLMMQDPHNQIVFSPGVTFVRMPEDLKSLDYESLAKNTATEDLSDYFKLEYRLPDDRHFFANWWGVLQLWKVQKAINSINNITMFDDFDKLFAKPNQEFNSYQGLIARYLHGDKENNIKSHLLELQKQENEKYGTRKRRISDYELILKDKEKELDEAIVKIEILKDAFSFDGSTKEFINKLNEIDQISLFSTQQIKNLIKIIESFPHEIELCQEYLEFKSKIEEEKLKIEQNKNKINHQISELLKHIEQEKTFSFSNFSLETITTLNSDKKNHPKIVFVDDQANDGWASIFQQMIYGGESQSFSIIIPQKEDRIEEIASGIIRKVFETKANLLILDLRLKGETGSNKNIDEISGIKVLNILTKEKLECPILITSASNKIWSYKETLNLGASAYWIKEGLDDNYNIESSIENYLRMLDLVYTLSFSDEYRYLYDIMLPKIKEITASKEEYWWQSKFWSDKLYIEKDRIKIEVQKSKLDNKKEVTVSLDAGFELFKDYLSGKIQNNNPTNINKSIASLVIIQFNNVLEIIHQIDDAEIYNLNARMKSQLNNQFDKYEKLLKIRNEATHNFNADFKAIKDYFELFITYLTSDIFFNNAEEPINNKYYTSEIESKSGYTCNLKNPSLKLKSGCTYIRLNYKENSKIKPEKCQPGDKIKFQLKISDNWGAKNYFAINAEIVNN